MGNYIIPPVGGGIAVIDLSTGGPHSLAVGDVGFIDFSAASVPLNVITGDDQVYEIVCACSMSAAALLYLSPNDTTYAGAFAIQYRVAKGAVTSSGNANYDKIRIGSGASGGRIFSVSTVSTKTTNKTGVVHAFSGASAETDWLATVSWSDTSTAWLSLATLSVPVGVIVGRVSVRRVS